MDKKGFHWKAAKITIAALDAIITEAAQNEVEEVVIGMAHRGRLNILANILQKTYEQIFAEFEGNAPMDSTMGSGDVKYHLGFTSDVVTPDGKTIELELLGQSIASGSRKPSSNWFCTGQSRYLIQK